MKSFVKTFTLILTVLSTQFAFAQYAHNANHTHDTMKKEVMSEKSAMIKDAPTVIDLSQTTGAYNQKELNLTEGSYIFKVTNQDVDKGLGFYLTPTADAKAQVTNSGLKALVKKGETSQTGVVELKAGEYQYNCPLNPTPLYKLNVAPKPTVINLSQTTGAYNQKELNLTEGSYIFEVTNQDVDKGLGFYLTPSSDAKAQVANSGLKALVKKGETSQTGVVELKAGEYQYNCPLNPTPLYKLNVAPKPTVINLSQTAGAYNQKELNLTEGSYIFEVTNQDVDKGLGFYLTPTADAKAQVTNSGLKALVKKGETSQTGVVVLKAGEYQYNCPLNPTPLYKLNVTAEKGMMKK